MSAGAFGRGLVVLVLAVVIVGDVEAQSLQAAEAQAFFARFVALGAAYDAALTELYAEDGRVRSVRRYPDGQRRTMEMTGTQWKGLIRSALPLAKAQGDRSDFTNVRIERAGASMRIRADRYSVRKCYWDRGYYLLISRQADGQIRIVEESVETQPQSDC